MHCTLANVLDGSWFTNNGDRTVCIMELLIYNINNNNNITYHQNSAYQGQLTRDVGTQLHVLQLNIEVISGKKSEYPLEKPMTTISQFNYSWKHMHMPYTNLNTNKGSVQRYNMASAS